jgi:anti-sigma factor RsiW
MTTILTPGSPRTPETDVPDLLLEQFRLDELDGAVRAEVTRRLAADPALRARLECLVQSDDDIRQLPWQRHLAQHAAGALRARTPRGVPPWVARGVPIAAAVALVGVIWFGNPWRVAGPGALDGVEGTGDVRIKGDAASLEVFRRTDGGSERLVDGAHARAGDVLRLGYRVAQPLYGVIASVDGRGVVTRHFPERGDSAAPLTPGDIVLLDRAFELDDAPRWERFHLLTSVSPFAIEAVVNALGDAGRPLPSTVDHAVVSVIKEPRP